VNCFYEVLELQSCETVLIVLHTIMYPSISVLLVYAWPCTTICVVIWGFKSFQKCVM
jgi:hypothetical protein